MAVGRAERRADRWQQTVSLFGEALAPVALDLLELLELAWHDSYGDVSPPEDLVEDMLVLSGGKLERLIQVALLGVTDWRDLKVAAEEFRNRS